MAARGRWAQRDSLVFLALMATLDIWVNQVLLGCVDIKASVVFLDILEEMGQRDIRVMMETLELPGPHITTMKLPQEAVWELVIVLLGMERSGPRVQLGSPDPQVMMAFLELKEREDGQGLKEGQVPEAHRAIQEFQDRTD
ncbi:unnamed protein product [Merluccius merluccius]